MDRDKPNPQTPEPSLRLSEIRELIRDNASHLIEARRTLGSAGERRARRLLIAQVAALPRIASLPSDERAELEGKTRPQPQP